MSPHRVSFLDDDELVETVRGGGEEGQEAYKELVKRHQAWLVRYLAYVLGSQAEAEDVAQEVYVKAWQKLATFRGESSFQTWLRSIATRLAYNRRRDRSTRARYEEEAGAELDLVFRPDGGDVDAREVLIVVLSALPYPYREILVLRHVEELEVSEIARALDVGLSAAKMRLKRAREAFWDRYTEVTDAPP